MNILSVNVNIIGHATYRRTLEATFAASFPKETFRSIPLTEEFERNFWVRALFAINVRRLPFFRSGDRDFFRLRSEMIMSLAAASAVRRQLKQRPADVVHFHTRSIAYFAAESCGHTPFVIDTDTTNAALANFRHREPRYSYRPLIALEARQYARAQRIIAWSEHARSSIINDYNIPSERVRTIHPGLPSVFFDPIWKDRRARGAQRGKVRILFIGNDFSRKGGNDLVAVFVRSLADGAELHLVSNSENLTSDHPAIFIHRGVSPLSEKLRELFTDADIFCLPTHEDTFTMALPEAMAAGLPCISTKIFGIPEAVVDGDNGYIIDPGDQLQLAEKLKRLIEDQSLRTRMGERSRTIYMEAFNPQKNVARMIEVFSEARKG